VVVFGQANSRPVVLNRRIEFTFMSNIKMNTFLQKYWPYVEGVCPLNLGNITDMFFNIYGKKFLKKVQAKY
jgi:hypothetical protein